jgi:Zn-dependent protease
VTAPAAPGPSGGVRIGSVLGVPVFVAPSWLLFAVVIVAVYGPVLSEGLGAARAYPAAGAFALLLLASVLLHEVGHCVVARAFDLPVRSITVTFLAGLTEITEPPQTPARDYAVAVVGPMVSLLLAGIGAGLTPLFEPGSLPYLLALGVAVTNGIVAAFNLLPGLPLDGGRVLRAGIWRLTGDQAGSTVAAAHAGRAVALVVVPGIVLVLLPALGLGRPTLVSLVFAALVGTFVFSGATASLRRAQIVRRLAPGTVGRLARPALGVRPDTPVSEAVRQAQAVGLHAVVVVDAEGRPQAVVSEAAVAATPEDRRPWISVADVSRRVDSADLLEPELGGEDLLAALGRARSTEHLVRPAPDGLPRVLVSADVVQLAGATTRGARARGRAAATPRR